MLDVSFDMSGLVAKLDAMVEKKLDGFPKCMADELTVWQIQDMHRRYPNTILKDKSVETDIWPHSRVVERDQKKIEKIIRARRQSAGRKSVGVVRSGTHRPILRPILYLKLVERMDELMEKELTWR